MITAGIDVGSAAIKAVFVDDGRLLWSRCRPTTALSSDACRRLFDEGMAELSISEGDVAGIATSGYGKSLFGAAGRKVNEITANALGAHAASQGRARTVINIGGQDIKIIKLDGKGKVVDFKLNDKCAAGTGRFFEMSERILGVPLDEFGPLSGQSSAPEIINSTCAVFAETELVSMLGSGKATADIIAGLHMSIASRIGNLTAAMDMDDEIYFDGGPALNTGLLQALCDELQRDVRVLEKPQFTVAYGAAIMASMSL